MIRPEITVTHGGRDITLAMQIDGLERVAAVNPKLGEVAQAIAQGVWEYAELVAILEAGLEAGGSGVALTDLYARHGLSGCVNIAASLMLAAWNGVDVGKPPAVEPTTAVSE